MKLWLLTRNSDCGYDENNAFVVRAADEAQARGFAAKDADDEGPEVWLNAGLSTCVELTTDGAPGIVLVDSLAG